MESFPQMPVERAENKEHKEEKKLTLEQFPWGAVGLELYKKEKEGEEHGAEKIERVKNALEAFVSEEIKNVRLYESAEGAAFPYTVIRVNEWAKALCEKEGIRPAAEPPAEASPGRRHIEFLATSVLSTENGHPFEFSDFVLHKAMAVLPEAIEAFRGGRTIPEREIYTFGFPTNELGRMTEEFTARMKEKPFETLGRVYADAVKELALSSGDAPELTLSGISMGANFAAEAAEKLIEEDAVTQKNRIDEPDKPRLTLNLYTPAGLNESLLKTPQIALGFGAEVAAQLASNPLIRRLVSSNKEFLHDLEDVLAERGIEKHSDPEDMKRKNQVTGLLGSIIMKLIQGVPVDENLKANKIIGTKDPTLYSPARNRAFSEQAAAHEGSLGARTIRDRHENQRSFGVAMSHTIPSFQATEIRRWDRVAETLGRAKNDRA